MKPVWGLLLACASCSALENVFGERGAGPPQPERGDFSAPEMDVLPRWVRPSEADLRRSEELVAAVEFLQRGEQERAAILLQRLRGDERFGPEVSALHAWSLLDAAAPTDAATVAREAALRHGMHPSLSYVMAVTLELRERPADALEHYRFLLGLAPGDPLLLRAAARTATAAGQPREALQHLEALQAGGAMEPADRALRAEALEDVGRYGEAASIHEALAEESGGDPVAQALAAEAVHRMARAIGDDDLHARAAALLEEVVEADPQHVDAFRMLGRSRQALGEDLAAEAAWRRCLELQPDDLDAGLALADLLFDRGDRDAAGEVLLGMLRQPLGADEVERIHAKMLEIGA